MASSSFNGLTPSTNDWDIIADAPEVTLDTSKERRVARLSKSRAWKEVSEFLDTRILAYSEYKPGINPAIIGTEADWRVADCVVNEIKFLKSYVENIS